MDNVKHTPGKIAKIVRGASGACSLEFTNGADMLDYAGCEVFVESPSAINAELLDVLVRARYAIEALDGTSIENEKLVDDYRAALAKVLQP